MRKMEKRLKLQRIARLLAMLLICVAVAVISVLLAKQMEIMSVFWLFTASVSIGAFFLIIAFKITEVVKKRRDEEEALMLLKAFNSSRRRTLTRKQLEF